MHKICNIPAHDIISMHGCDNNKMNEFVLSISSHVDDVASPKFVPEKKDEETMTTNDQSGHFRRVVKKCLVDLLLRGMETRKFIIRR